MRRVVLFFTGLCLLGLSTAFAASFTVQAEDIHSFSTPVSISVPGPAPLPATIYVRGEATGGTGALDLQAPAANDSVTGKLLRLSTEPAEAQTDTTKHFVWKTVAAPASGWLLSGNVTLYISQNGGGSNRMTAGLFSCPSAAPAVTVTTGTAACTVIKIAVGAPGSSGNGYQERTVSFGPVGSFTIPSGSQLRLKIVNRANNGSVLSTGDWDLQWGYLPSRQSKLVIAP